MKAEGRIRSLSHVVLTCLPGSAYAVLRHILTPAKPEGKAARITYFAEHQARENTKPHGNVDRS